MTKEKPRENGDLFAESILNATSPHWLHRYLGQIDKRKEKKTYKSSTKTMVIQQVCFFLWKKMRKKNGGTFRISNIVGLKVKRKIQDRSPKKENFYSGR